MAVYVAIGAQWGDEGKGKVCDHLAARMDLVVRYQGGANAGHTVVFDGNKIVLHQIPSGILSPRARCVIGSGCVVDPEILVSELGDLASVGARVSPSTLRISEDAHLVTPVHRFLDAHLNTRIGTTGRGIGPCYTDKVQRTGIRLSSITDGSWKAQVRQQAELHERLCREILGVGFIDVEAAVQRMEPATAELAPFIGDAAPLIHETIRTGGAVLYEGAQGTWLDIDHGTYPFVTSSTTTIGGALSGGGVYVQFDRRIAVIKAYTTRVGEGPFPTELMDPTGDRLREAGREYGATTGRPRRCGWLDLHLCDRAFVINGFDYIVLTKLDCLSGFPVIRVAVGRAPGGAPDYVDLEGWEESITGIHAFDALPEQARRYVELIEHHLGAPVGMISTGPDRHQIIIREEP